MSLWDFIRWSLRQIRVRFMESILIILGIALGVAVITSVAGLVQNFQQQTDRSMQNISMRVLELIPTQNDYYDASSLPFRRIGRSGEEPLTLTYTDYKALQEAKIEGVAHVWVASARGEMKKSAEPLNRETAQTYEQRRKWEEENLIRYILVFPEALEVAGVALLKGDTIREADVLNKSKVALIGDELAQRTFGDTDPVGQTVQLERGEFVVIGVVHRDVDPDPQQRIYIRGIGDLGDINQSLLIPYFSYDTGRMMGKEAETFDEGIYMLTEENALISRVYARVRNYVDQQYGDRISVTGIFRYQEKSKESILAVGKAVGILACAALLIAAINILNLMMARVLRRSRQIGISRAVGGSKRDLFWLFLTEALLLGMIGSIFGLGLGYGALELLSTLIREQLRLTPLTYLIGFGAALLTSLIFGLYPAAQAAAAHPAEVLKKD